MDLKNKIFEIQKLISLNKKSQAKDQCEKLIKKFPDNSFVLNMYGLILQSVGRINESINYFEKKSFIPISHINLDIIDNSMKFPNEYFESNYLKL